MSAVLVSASVLVPSAGQAAPVQPLCFAAPAAAKTATDPNAEATAHNIAVVNLRRAGKTATEIDSVLRQTYGLEKVGTTPSPQIEPMSSPSNLTVRAPTIYRNSCTGKYEVFAYWDFTSIPALKADAGCGNCTVGTDDVMGLVLSRVVADPGGYSVQTWGASSVYPPAARNISDNSGAGFAMQDNDRFCSASNCGLDDYNMYHGQMVMTIDSPGCGPLTAYSKYGHSWSTVVLTGVSISAGIGSGGIGISWSEATHSYNKAGAGASNTVTPC